MRKVDSKRCSGSRGEFTLWSSDKCNPNDLPDLTRAPRSISHYLLSATPAADPCYLTSVPFPVASNFHTAPYIPEVTPLMLLRHNSPAHPRHLRLLVRQLRTQPLNDYQQPDNGYTETQLPAYGLATPREVCPRTRPTEICIYWSGVVGTILEPIHCRAGECQESSIRGVSHGLPGYRPQ